MADIRINALATTATTPASDDYLALDGAAQGTRKILATNIANNVTDVILGASGPSVKSTLSARAPRQGLVFDGTAGATVSVPAFGTSDFSISWFGTVTSLAAVRGLVDSSASLSIAVLTDGSIRIYDRGSASNVTISAAGAIVAGKAFHLVYVRGQLYLNGVALGSSFTDTLNYSSGITKIGESAFGYWLGTLGCTIYNRALSASEVVSLYEAGAPAAYDFRQTSSQLFSGAWTGSGVTSTGPDNIIATNVAANPQSGNTLSVKAGEVYKLTGSFSNITGTPKIGMYVGGWVTTQPTVTATGATFTVLQSATGAIFFDGTGSLTGTSVKLERLGLLLAPDAAQAGGGLVWYDTSGNAANISWTSGVSWNVPSSLKLGGNWNLAGTLTSTVTSGSSPILTASNTSSGGYSIIRAQNDVGGASGNFDLGIGGSGVGGSYQNWGYLYTGGGLSGIRFATTATIQMTLNNSGNVLIGTTTDGGQKLQVAGAIAATTGAANNALVARYNSSNSLFGVTVNSAGQGVVSENTDASTGSDKYSKTGLPAFRLGNTGGSGTVPFWIDVAASGTAGNAITWTNAFQIDSSQNATFAGTIAIGQYTTAGAPAYAKGKLYFDVTLNKLRVGGATGWETITSV